MTHHKRLRGRQYPDTLTREHVDTPLMVSGVRVEKLPIHSPEDGTLALAALLWGPSLQPPSWHEHAACRDYDSTPFDRGWNEAREICSTCPVRELCRADQQQWEAHHRSTSPATVRGGLTAGQRAAERKKTQTRQHADTPTRADVGTSNVEEVGA